MGRWLLWPLEDEEEEEEEFVIPVVGGTMVKVGEKVPNDCFVDDGDHRCHRQKDPEEEEVVVFLVKGEMVGDQTVRSSRQQR